MCDNLKNLKTIKRSGTYYRHLKKNLAFIRNKNKILISNRNIEQNTISGNISITDHLNIATKNIERNILQPSVQDINNLIITSNINESDSDDENDLLINGIRSNDFETQFIFQSSLQSWAVLFNIRQTALKSLLDILRISFPNLARDPRTLLRNSSKVVQLQNLSKGSYWHQGLELCIRNYFADINISTNISLNINVDGLPVYKSSKEEFWPILVSIFEFPNFSPMVVGIYSGIGKPPSAMEYLKPFVNELKSIILNGIVINGHKIYVRVRAFICDSPARAFIKGVANFNSQHGCLKCTTIGEYSYTARCNIFPVTNCQKRTNENFRAKKYETHHKFETPLEELPIDMIEDIPVGDELHLLELGIMKRLLLGYRDGNLKNYDTKWSAKDIENISKLLKKVQLPSEIHRAVRDLQYLSHWKGVEYRNFLLYIGVVVLKENLPYYAYEHFLILFCSVTICSSQKYFHLLDLAEQLIDHYIEKFRDIYGEDLMTSNIHNLSHLVDEVRRFGILYSFSAYPFENMLSYIKRLLRTGYKPLSQIARRIEELNKIVKKPNNNAKMYPFVEKPLKKEEHKDLILNEEMSNISNLYAKIKINCNFGLNKNHKDKWFLTKTNQIVEMKVAAETISGEVVIYGSALKNIKDFFDTPIKSSRLNIYLSDCEQMRSELFSTNSIRCKMNFQKLQAKQDLQKNLKNCT